MNGRAAYTNTIMTARLRETLKKEMKVTDKHGPNLAATSLHNITERRRRQFIASDGNDDRMKVMDAMIADRRYKPTSSVAIGTSESPTLAAPLCCECNVLLRSPFGPVSRRRRLNPAVVRRQSSTWRTR